MKETDNKNLAFDEHHVASVTGKDLGTKVTRKRKVAETVTELEPEINYDADGETASTTSGFHPVVSKRSRLRGKLADMMKMPVDIFAEVLFFN